MSRNTLPLVLALLSLAACRTKVEKVEAVDAYGYTERYTRDPEDYARQGRYQKLDSAGQLVEEANFVDDTLHGLRALYFENGDTQIVEHYQMGIFDGPYRVYYPEGSLQLEGQYSQNEMKGDWLKYYPNGQLMERVRFEGNLENGPFVEYHENGNLKAEGTYRNGDKEHGELRLYDENGTLERKMDCENGICRTTWKREAPSN